ncbi:response regulator [Ktedonobacteria bacterium brp13]|nr:response regulator [Ktedonobacteria bacterium brp13]
MYDAAQKRRILVVEDELAIQQVLCFFLKHHNFEVLAASNGQEAMRVIPLFRPHLIILDLMMQPGTGWDVLHWLRDQHLTPRIPVLIVSALVHLSEQMQGFEEGAIEYITKPTQPSVIVERVRALLSLDVEQRAMLQHKRMDEQRKTLDRLSAVEPDEFTY